MKPEIEAALTHAHTQLLDILHGWPEKELHEPLQETIDRIESVLSEAVKEVMK